MLRIGSGSGLTFPPGDDKEPGECDGANLTVRPYYQEHDHDSTQDGYQPSVRRRAAVALFSYKRK